MHTKRMVHPKGGFKPHTINAEAQMMRSYVMMKI